VLPDQLQDPGGPLPVRAAARPGSAAPCARAWQSGCLILVSGSGSDPALAATAGAASHLAVVALPERHGAGRATPVSGWSRAPELSAS